MEVRGGAQQPERQSLSGQNFRGRGAGAKTVSAQQGRISDVRLQRHFRKRPAGVVGGGLRGAPEERRPAFAEASADRQRTAALRRGIGSDLRNMILPSMILSHVYEFPPGSPRRVVAAAAGLAAGRVAEYV